jgi:hypothetical protein
VGEHGPYINAGDAVVENIGEFDKRLDKVIEDGRKELGMTDETIAYVLLNEGMKHYFKTLSKCLTCEGKTP